MAEVFILSVTVLVGSTTSVLLYLAAKADAESKSKDTE